MPAVIVALACGLLFGLGLTVSAMIDPGKVLNFLDIAGTWDPSLALVMAGAIPLALVGFRIAQARSCPVMAEKFLGPSAARIDARLVAGALLFGIGWGLVGYCPGPALAALGLADPRTWIFVTAMLAGMALHGLWPKKGSGAAD